MSLFFRAFSFSFLLVVSASSVAGMLVETSILYFTPGEPSRKDVEIKNPDPDPLYIEVIIYEVKNPGEENEERIVVKNPKDVNFLVTPNRLVIPPGSRKLVRFVNMKPKSNEERVFRVTFKPVPADLEADVTGVKVLVGYQLLVLMSPQEPVLEVVHKRDPASKKLVLQNKGNVNAVFRQGYQCKEGVEYSTETENQCAKLAETRLYPGNTLEIAYPYSGQSIHYLMQSYGKNQLVEY